jgi:shikimate kinase
MLRTLALNEPAIISCGGGTPCFFDNMDFMNENGITVLLDASPAYILENIKHEPGKRPLINNLNEAELLFFIEQKIKERIPYYSRAKLILSAPDLEPGSFEKIVHTINW